MDKNATTITGVEQGRAKFAYECANQVVTLSDFTYGTFTIATSGLIKTYLENKFKDPKTKQFKDQSTGRMVSAFLQAPQQQYKAYKDKQPSREGKIEEAYAKYGKEYKSLVKKIPMLIKTNGLGAAFAFVLSKADNGNPNQLIYHQTAEWLKHDSKGLIHLTDNSQLAHELVQKKSAEYRAITVEVLAFFTWLKRFAEGLIEGEADD